MSVRPSVRRPHELEPCISAVFYQNYYQYERGRILCRVSGLVLLTLTIDGTGSPQKKTKAKINLAQTRMWWIVMIDKNSEDVQLFITALLLPLLLLQQLHRPRLLTSRHVARSDVWRRRNLTKVGKLKSSSSALWDDLSKREKGNKELRNYYKSRRLKLRNYHSKAMKKSNQIFYR